MNGRKAMLAALQMNSTEVLHDNLLAAERLLRQAAQQGATLAVLPENFALMGAHERDKLEIAERFQQDSPQGPIQSLLSTLAKELALWIVAGTVPLQADSEHAFAASLLYNPQGQCMARYDKIHLFDVNLPNGEHYRESHTIAYGDPQPVTAALPWATLGFSICYDLRFPELYRALMQLGANVLCVPSAFTAKTGEVHWLPLLRARAIENQCYIVAPNQTGTHAGGRKTWGHSVILDPWGSVLAELPEGEGVITAPFDLAMLETLRAAFPVLGHRRLA
jgi:nitrilase